MSENSWIISMKPFSSKLPSDTQTKLIQQEAWDRLRGALKEVFAELGGGGEAYLRRERVSFRDVDGTQPLKG